MRCVLEGISLLLGGAARAAVRASDRVAGTPRGYIGASHVLTRVSLPAVHLVLLYLCCFCCPAVLLFGAVLFSCP